MEAAAPAFAVIGHQSSLVRIDDIARDCQSESNARDRRLRVAALKRTEKFFFLTGRQTGATITDSDIDAN